MDGLLFWYHTAQVPAEIRGIFPSYTVDEDDDIVTDHNNHLHYSVALS